MRHGRSDTNGLRVWTPRLWTWPGSGFFTRLLDAWHDWRQR